MLYCFGKPTGDESVIWGWTYDKNNEATHQIWVYILAWIYFRFFRAQCNNGSCYVFYLLSQRHCACRNLPPPVPPGPQDSPTNISRLSETQHRGGWADVSCGSHLYKFNTLLSIEWILLNCGAGKDLRILWKARRSNQSILKENKPEYSLEDAESEAPILWSPDVKSQLTGKDRDAEKDWGQEKGVTGWDGWMASLIQWTWVWANSERL